MPVASFELVGGRTNAEPIIEEIVRTWGFPRQRVLDVYSCSPLQEGLIALSVANPGAYVAQELYALPSDVDVGRFKASCLAAVLAHAILRTRIVQLESSKLMQVVLEEDTIEWLTGDSVEAYVAMSRDTMSLGKRLTDWAIINTNPKTFVWTKHHAIYDGYSLDLLIRTIGDFYYSAMDLDLGATHNNNIPLPVVGYNTFIKYLIQQDRNESQEYWRQYLAGSTRTNFPRRRGSSTSKEAKPDHCIVHDIQLVKGHHDIDTTVPLLVRTAWAILLAKYTGSDDVVFGTVLSGRTAPIPDIMNIPGPTFTTVPVRAKFPESSSMRVAQLVEEIRNDAAKAIPHEYFGLQNIKGISQDIRDACDFDTLLVIQSESHVGNSLLQPIGVTSQHTFRTYALTLDCQIIPSGIRVNAYFDDTLIVPRQMSRLMEHFEAILYNLSLGSEVLQLKDLSMTTSSDLSQVWAWNSSPPPMVNNCIHNIIGEQMIVRSQSAAIHSWDGALTYSELDRFSSRLAHHLVGLGVSYETKVPLVFEKSLWTVVAMLGVLRAGGAFVPLDASNHPPARLEALIRQVDGRSLALASEANVELASALSDSVFVVSRSSLELLPDSCSWKSVKMKPNSPAYVHFTSGSTGTPKPVVVEHFAYCTGASAHIPKVRITNSSRVLQFASYSFDDCIMNILTTLMVGACVCVPSEMERGGDIAGAIKRMNVNWAHLTPSVTKLIKPDDVPSLKTLLLGGEAVTSHHVQQWSGRLQLINVYGPSELCVMCAANDNSKVSEPADVGKAVGCVSWVVDANDHTRLAPIGVVGELVIEAHMMARGYYKQNTLTAAVFLEAPGWLKRGFGAIPGRTGRVYKTGDLVRYGPDGTLVYVGRKDKQIKIRGKLSGHKLSLWQKET